MPHRSADIGVTDLLRGMGPRLIARTAREQTWFTQHFLGLRCDLEALPERPRAQIEVQMTPVGRGFTGFVNESRRVDGEDARAVYLRQRMVNSTVDMLYAACDGAREPIYAQWLIKPSSWIELDCFSPRRYPKLAESEVFLEFAYTFVQFRGARAMADGMWQLLDIARKAGAKSALTYVTPDNVPSLRGCARVGFEIDHVRRNERRLGWRRSSVGPVNDDAGAAWRSATR